MQSAVLFFFCEHSPSLASSLSLSGSLGCVVNRHMGTADQRSRSRARVNQINQLGFVNPRKDPSAAAPRICVSLCRAPLARPVTRETLSVTSFWQAPRLRNHRHSQACRIPSNSLGVFLGLSAQRSERGKKRTVARNPRSTADGGVA